jgi:hypothetical protein
VGDFHVLIERLDGDFLERNVPDKNVMVFNCTVRKLVSSLLIEPINWVSPPTDEYCEICGEDITLEDYEDENVKVPIDSGDHARSVHVDCENERLGE